MMSYWLKTDILTSNPLWLLFYPGNYIFLKQEFFMPN